ncbi:MAG TPA: lipid biosynthesis B12-binding/radical SAM protein [Dissulfurispiraceae bacterium]|nr:lipid biosynthesis B12-binding/radical SAM protein [Dissulfurispiraceae bacterium]
MKILLISVNKEREPYPVAPIGTACVASALKQEGHDICILDLCFEEHSSKVIEKVASDFGPDIVGLSIRNVDNLTFGKSINYMPSVKEVVETVKSTCAAGIVAGGSGFSIFPEESLRYLALDLGIAGEGEDAFAQLIAAYESGGSFDSVPNLCRIVNGNYVANSVQSKYKFSKPDRSFLDNAKYMELGGMGNIQAKRGCPFSCTYCTYPAIEGCKVRLRNASDVVEEIIEAHNRYGIDHMFFVDDIFNFPEEHAIGICEEMIRRKAAVDWTCFATPFGMSREMAYVMKKAGCKGIEFGTDGGSERTLEALGKRFLPSDIERASNYCMRVGLPHAHYIIIGGPGEDADTLEDTFTLFDRLGPTAVIAIIGVRIYPNTLLRQRAINEGIVREDDSLFNPVFYLTNNINSDELIKTVAGLAADRPNWIVPALGLRCDTGMMTMLRKNGRKGPLWDLL